MFVDRVPIEEYKKMDLKEQYKTYCKPKLAELLSALKLDVCAVSAEGNYIISEDERKNPGSGQWIWIRYIGP